MKDVNRLLARQGLYQNVTVQSVVDLWTPTESQKQAAMALETYSMNNATIPSLTFTVDCGVKVASVVVSFLTFVPGLVMAIPSKVQQGITAYVNGLVQPIAQVIAKCLKVGLKIFRPGSPWSTR